MRSRHLSKSEKYVAKQSTVHVHAAGTKCDECSVSGDMNEAPVTHERRPISAHEDNQENKKEKQLVGNKQAGEAQGCKAEVQPK